MTDLDDCEGYQHTREQLDELRGIIDHQRSEHQVLLQIIARTAREVDEPLSVLQGELDSTKNPHRVALRSLGLDQLGWTHSAYSDEAFRIWGERLRRDPDDLETLHHLAIMHHARAMDLETGPKPRESDADWQKALDYWARLWRSDPFWEGIVAQACRGAKADAVDALRKELPGRLLQVHFDIALDESNRKERPHRSAYHLELARRSGFPKGSIEEVQRASYAVWLRGVPDAVWRTDELEPKVIQEAAGVILDFLDLVPECLPALEDAARLQVRMLNAWYTDFQAVGEEDPRQRQRLLSDFQTAGKRWRPHFDRLVTLVEQTDESTRHDLCLWYRIMAEIHRALDRSDDAERLYKLGMLAGDQDDEDVARCSRGLGETRALAAREKAASGAGDARASCDRARDTAGLSLLAHLVLAQAYLLIKEFAQAKDLCDRGLNRELDATDLDDYEGYQHIREQLDELRGIIEHQRIEHRVRLYIDKAQGHMEGREFAKAIPELDGALEVNPESAPALFLRCQCCIAEGRAGQARRDLDRFRHLVEAVNSKEGLEAAKNLETKQLRPLEELVKRYGNERAFALRRQAIQAWNDDRHEEALSLLRRAYDESKAALGRRGSSSLAKELSEILTGVAVRRVNAIPSMQIQGFTTDLESLLGLSPREVQLEGAAALLREAVELDATNVNARQSLATIQTMKHTV